MGVLVSSSGLMGTSSRWCPSATRTRRSAATDSSNSPVVTTYAWPEASVAIALGPSIPVVSVGSFVVHVACGAVGAAMRERPSRVEQLPAIALGPVTAEGQGSVAAPWPPPPLVAPRRSSWLRAPHPRSATATRQAGRTARPRVTPARRMPWSCGVLSLKGAPARSSRPPSPGREDDPPASPDSHAPELGSASASRVQHRHPPRARRRLGIRRAGWSPHRFRHRRRVGQVDLVHEALPRLPVRARYGAHEREREPSRSVDAEAAVRPLGDAALDAGAQHPPSVRALTMPPAPIPARREMRETPTTVPATMLGCSGSRRRPLPLRRRRAPRAAPRRGAPGKVTSPMAAGIR